MSSSSPDNRILPLSSLRFLLAVWIFVHHLYPVWWMPISRHLGEFVTGFFVAGFVAVPFFFMLSGFVLTIAYGSATRMNKHERLRFWLRRFSRLAPAFYLALFIGIFPYYGMVLKHVDTSVGVLIGTVRDLLTNVLFLGVASQRALIMNNSSWTISVEAIFYSIFPFFCPIVFRMQRRGVFATLVACVAACVGMQLLVMHFHPIFYDWRASQFRPPYYFGDHEEKWRFFFLANPLFHFPEFLMGVALARL
ncbi:MAG: acyltransferase family protein, partial [Bdellovibrionota bacterium]